MGIRVRVRVNPNPNPSMQMRCKWGRRGELIQNNFILVLPLFQIGINYIGENFLGFPPFCISSFVFLFCSRLLPSLSTVDPLEHLAPAIWPRGRGGWLFCVERTRLIGWCFPRREVSRSGERWPSRKFCPRKNGPPQGGSLETTQGSSR